MIADSMLRRRCSIHLTCEGRLKLLACGNHSRRSRKSRRRGRKQKVNAEEVLLKRQRKKEEFRAYANEVDPEGLFWSGYVADTLLTEMVW